MKNVDTTVLDRGGGTCRRNAGWGSAACLAGIALGLAAPADAGGPPAVRYDRNILSDARLGPVPGGFESWKALFAEQARLNAAARALQADTTSASHLASIVADPAARRLQVFWKGALPERTRALLADLRRNAAIEIVPSQYSEAELLATAQQLVRDRRVVWAAANIDGSGLDVTLDQQLDVAERSEILGRLEHVARVAGVPRMHMEISYGSNPVPVHTRDAGGSPMYAGARIFQSWDSVACSLGFAAQDGATGAVGWLTAYHCIPNVQYTGEVYGGREGKDERGSFYLGKYDSLNRITNYDVTFIKAAKAAYAPPLVHVGRAHGEGVAIPVGGSAPSYKGNYVFTSGSSTGLNGALQVTHTRTTYQKTGSQTRAVHTQYGVSAAHGDSGGAVFAFMVDGMAEARGVITMRDIEGGNVTCPSVHRVRTGDVCAIAMWFADMDLISTKMNLNVLVGDWP